ncbi:hypothetical protein FQR65_LT20781 [Abscondita terminalis]|nr:hypothetical protein FQR65_LT20781 [Abscondita terminalis]
MFCARNKAFFEVGWWILPAACGAVAPNRDGPCADFFHASPLFETHFSHGIHSRRIVEFCDVGFNGSANGTHDKKPSAAAICALYRGTGCYSKPFFLTLAIYMVGFRSGTQYLMALIFVGQCFCSARSMPRLSSWADIFSARPARLWRLCRRVSLSSARGEFAPSQCRGRTAPGCGVYKSMSSAGHLCLFTWMMLSFFQAQQRWQIASVSRCWSGTGTQPYLRMRLLTRPAMSTESAMVVQAMPAVLSEFRQLVQTRIGIEHAVFGLA